MTGMAFEPVEATRRPSRWRQLAGGLRARAVLATLGVFLITALPTVFAFERVVERVIVDLGRLFAEKQVLFDRYRGLETLQRETALARALATSPDVVAWAREEADPERRARGVATLAHFRTAFQDRSAFFVANDSGNYYFGDDADPAPFATPRYRLDRHNPRDGWYFTTAALPLPCALNVDRDDTLGVTKVWINCLVRDNGQVLGIIGTGLDLSGFIREVVDIPQTGVENMFVDASGAIQAHRDPRQVDFHSLTKLASDRRTIYRLLDGEEDRRTMAELISTMMHSGKDEVVTRFVRIGGRDYLAGVAFLDQLGWFNVTLMDLDAIIDRRFFAPIGLVLAAALSISLVLVTLLFDRQVVRRLRRLERSMDGLAEGRFAPPAVSGPDELGRLGRAMERMARRVGGRTRVLEHAVAIRTAELERLALTDPLTDLGNRRGLVAAFEAEREAAERAGAELGLLLVDIDRFKAVNDLHGHAVGDTALRVVAEVLRECVRGTDHCARWGAEEFLLLLPRCNAPLLARIAEELNDAIRRAHVPVDEEAELAMTVSIGGCVVQEAEALDAAVARAGAALERVKRAGRDGALIAEAATVPRG